MKNENGSFVRETLNLALSDKKAYEMKSGDMNADEVINNPDIQDGF